MKYLLLLSVILLFFFTTPVHAATFTVNSTADLADTTINGVCSASGGVCTLRAAIQEANATTTQDTINFSIGSGLKQITPSPTFGGSLPTISQPVILNAKTQPGYSSAPLIQINGGLVITGGTSQI